MLWLSPAAQAHNGDPYGAPVCMWTVSGKDCSARDLYRHIDHLRVDDGPGLQASVVGVIGPCGPRDTTVQQAGDLATLMMGCTVNTRDLVTARGLGRLETPVGPDSSGCPGALSSGWQAVPTG